MLHINWYLSSGRARLAAEAGVSRSSLSRVLSGQRGPSFSFAWKVTQAVERRLTRLWKGTGREGTRLDPCELFSLDGSYPTPAVCALCGCPGCRVGRTWEQEQARRWEQQQAGHGHSGPGTGKGGA